MAQCILFTTPEAAQHICAAFIYGDDALRCLVASDSFRLQGRRASFYTRCHRYADRVISLYAAGLDAGGILGWPIRHAQAHAHAAGPAASPLYTEPAWPRRRHVARRSAAMRAISLFSPFSCLYPAFSRLRARNGLGAYGRHEAFPTRHKRHASRRGTTWSSACFMPRSYYTMPLLLDALMLHLHFTLGMRSCRARHTPLPDAADMISIHYRLSSHFATQPRLVPARRHWLAQRVTPGFGEQHAYGQLFSPRG